MHKVYIRLAIAILKASLPTLRKKAAETKSDIDNIVLDIVEAVVQLIESGELRI